MAVNKRVLNHPHTRAEATKLALLWQHLEDQRVDGLERPNRHSKVEHRTGYAMIHMLSDPDNIIGEMWIRKMAAEGGFMSDDGQAPCSSISSCPGFLREHCPEFEEA